MARFVVHRRRSMAAIVAVTSTIALAAGCSSTPGPTYSSDVTADGAHSLDSLLTPSVTVSELGRKKIVDGADNIQPGAPVTVNADAGRLTNVQITSAAGVRVKGVLSNNGKTWTSAEPFGYNKQYTITAEASGVGGTTAVKPISFSTTAPSNLAAASLNSGDPTVGIGQPVAVKFDTRSPTVAPFRTRSRSPPPRRSRAPSTGSAIPQCVGAPSITGSRAPKWMSPSTFTAATSAAVCTDNRTSGAASPSADRWS